MAQPWSNAEAQAFLCLLADEQVQSELDGTKRNKKIFQEVSAQMAVQGFHRTPKQRGKLKKLIADDIKWTGRLAHKIHLEQLDVVGLLHGDVEDMLKVHLSSIFMPHGLGHLLGLHVHNVEGLPGGSHTEDDIAVTADGVELLTCVPHTVEEIEAFMSDSSTLFSPVVSAE